jgi:hypothetical protein
MHVNGLSKAKFTVKCIDKLHVVAILFLYPLTCSTTKVACLVGDLLKQSLLFFAQCI